MREDAAITASSGTRYGKDAGTRTASVTSSPPQLDMTDSTALAESLRSEAIHTAAVHEEAQAKARSADMHSVVTAVFREVLSDPDGSPLLIKRIPFICYDIALIKKLIWIILSANGAVLLLLVGLAIQRAFS